MQRTKSLRALALLAGILGFLMPAELGAAAQIGWEPAATKVRRADPDAGLAGTVTVEAARNEYEGFQIVIRAAETALADVDVVLSDLTGPDGAVLPAHHATLYREHFLTIAKPSPCDPFFGSDCTQYPQYDRPAGDYPDPLLPFVDPYDESHPPVAAPFEVAAGDLAVVFVDLYVPAGIPAGEYSGEVRVTAGDDELATLVLQLTVWDFDLPAKRNVATAYGFSYKQAKKFHPKESAAETDTVLRNYEWEVHRHRIDFINYNPGLEFAFDEAGTLISPDFTAWDAHIGPRIDGTYYPDGAGLNRFNLGMMTPGHGTMGLTDDQFSQAARAVAEHLQEKGWLDHVYLYSLDEPWVPEHWQAGSYEKIKQGVDLLNALTSLWQGHVLVTGPWQPQLDGYVDIWCPVTPMYGDTFWPAGSWPGPKKYAALMAEGRELWFYVCNANFPPQMGYDIDTPVGHEPRLVKWGAWYEHATGFLFWSMTYWFSGDPWHDFANYEQFGEPFSRNGDGVLIYPGNRSADGLGAPVGISLDGPVVSYRMKQIRDGLEDWELFLLAAELGAEEWTRTQVETAYRAFGASLDGQFDPQDPPWTVDGQTLYAARRNVARKVQHLLHPERWPDPEFPPTSPDSAPDAVTAEILADTIASQTDTAADAGSPPTAGTPRSAGCQAGGHAPSSLVLALLVGVVLLPVVRRRRVTLSGNPL